jgi:hypothetical protein
VSLSAPEQKFGLLDLDKVSRGNHKSSMRMWSLLLGFLFSFFFFFFLKEKKKNKSFSLFIWFIHFPAAAQSFDLAASTTRDGASCAAQVPCSTLSPSNLAGRKPNLLVTLLSAASGPVLHFQTVQEPQGQQRGPRRVFIGMPETYCLHGRL